MKRRQVIFRRVVLDNRPIRLSELPELLADPAYDESRAKTDVDEFRAVGCAIRLRPCTDNPDEKEFVFLEGQHTDDDTVREGINAVPKALVARVTAGIICGLAKTKEKDLLPDWLLTDEVAKALRRLFLHNAESDLTLASVRSIVDQVAEKTRWSRGESVMDSAELILERLEQSKVAREDRVKTLKSNLKDHWAESNRLVALDSGTTNVMIARYLSQLRLPMPGSPLCSLSVCTNSRRIFEILGDSSVSIKTIIIGGQQKFRSPTIAGAMAELFLRTASILQFGMCILGATKIDVQRFAACSDSQEESSMKHLMMQKSSLRIIAADSSKFQSGPGREGYKFASLDPSHIDLIITNSPIRKVGKKVADEEEFAHFRNMVGAIESRGVPVLIGTSSSTFGHAYEQDSNENPPS